MSLSAESFSPLHILGYLADNSRGISSCNKNPIICGFGIISLPKRNPFVPILLLNIDSHVERTTSTISSGSRGWFFTNRFVTSNHFVGPSPLYGEAIKKFLPTTQMAVLQTHERSQQYFRGLHFVPLALLHQCRFYEAPLLQQALLVTNLLAFANGGYLAQQFFSDHQTWLNNAEKITTNLQTISSNHKGKRHELHR